MKAITTFIIHVLIIIVSLFLVYELSGWTVNLSGVLLISILIFVILWLLSWFYDRQFFSKVPKIFGLTGFFLQELFIASLEIVWEVLTPKHRMESGLIALPLDAKTDLEITLLASLISLTPGTLSLDVSRDRETLYVHAVYIRRGDIELLKNQIKFGFERRLLEITR